MKEAASKHQSKKSWRGGSAAAAMAANKQ